MYPKQALVFQRIDYRDSYGDLTFELVGIRKDVLCLKFRDVATKSKMYHMMRGDLLPLTIGAKKFLDEVF